MFNKMADFLDKNHILYEHQYGFQKNYSTEFALLELSDKIAQARDEKKIMNDIFVDLSKEFDTLNHEILLKKLEFYGIRGIANDWCKSYLSDRSQLVMCNNVLSESCYIITGVPQGSILGPLLFLLYINDICNSSKLLHSVLYADETNMFYSCENINELCAVVNRELQCYAVVYFLFITNRLSVNIKKTNFMLFGSQAKLRNFTNSKIFFKNMEIVQTNTAKYLRVLRSNSTTQTTV